MRKKVTFAKMIKRQIARLNYHAAQGLCSWALIPGGTFYFACFADLEYRLALYLGMTADAEQDGLFSVV